MIDIDELERLHKESTQGSWRLDGPDIYQSTGKVIGHYLAHEGGGRILVTFANCLTKTAEQAQTNAAYIAAAHNTLPALIAELRAYRRAEQKAKSDPTPPMAHKQ